LIFRVRLFPTFKASVYTYLSRKYCSTSCYSWPRSQWPVSDTDHDGQTLRWPGMSDTINIDKELPVKMTMKQEAQPPSLLVVPRTRGRVTVCLRLSMCGPGVQVHAHHDDQSTHFGCCIIQWKEGSWKMFISACTERNFLNSLRKCFQVDGVQLVLTERTRSAKLT
jgi:hypothetical protein